MDKDILLLNYIHTHIHALFGKAGEWGQLIADVDMLY